MRGLQQPDTHPLTGEEQPIRDWVGAFNARDLDGMLACMSPDIDFRPVRLYGLERTYRGHDGVARWYERLARLDLSYEIAIETLALTDDATILAVGELRYRDIGRAGPFWGVHRVDGGMIVSAQHFITDPAFAERFLPG